MVEWRWGQATHSPFAEGKATHCARSGPLFSSSLSMARTARLVVPGLPHHVTQRGARRMQVFFSDEDYRSYLRILADEARRHELGVWAYCLMPNHVHLIATPPSEPSLAKALGEAHRRYAWRVNRRQGWTGHLWQERFSSCAMDEPHLSAAIRYVLLNPVRAGLATTASAWPYSSARAHLGSAADELVETQPAALRIKDWDNFLRLADSREETEELRRHSRIGRPLGSDAFLDELEQATGRPVRPARAGRRPRAAQ